MGSTLGDRGQVLTHVADNDLDRTNVSQGTRDMAQGRVNFGTMTERDAAVTAARRTLNDTIDDVKSLELRLSEINAQVRGQRLDPRYYRYLCTQQNEIKKRIGDSQKAIKESRLRLSEISNAMIAGRHVAETGVIRDQLLEEINRNVLLILARLDRLEQRQK